MLLPREQSPWNCGYYLGAIALRALDQLDRRADLRMLREEMIRLLGRSLSPTQIVSAAAWLYLIDAIKLEDDGVIVKCD